MNFLVLGIDLITLFALFLIGLFVASIIRSKSPYQFGIMFTLISWVFFAIFLTVIDPILHPVSRSQPASLTNYLRVIWIWPPFAINSIILLISGGAVGIGR